MTRSTGAAISTLASEIGNEPVLYSGKPMGAAGSAFSVR